MPGSRSKDQPAPQASDKSTSPSPPRANPDIDTNLLPPGYWAQLDEGGDDRGDADSTVSDNASSTASLTSSILEYRTIHGRSYQSDRGNADYWFVEVVSQTTCS
ncbi:hypothetical protein NW762_013093 [Fusarium torreyae]|uniref:Uncharacterized protein n=1 Tax=Fusarium torreyae TaxID=1237075 RepID=A0A9W8RPR8_9HYPO|nr:hypothetical protein NW762_013093 [Fusarium torreyae]